MAERVGRGPADAAVAILLGSAALATVVGCGVEAMTPFDYGDDASVRLTGGSIPGGQKVCGYALCPFDGAGVRDVGGALWVLADALVTLQGPSGATLSDWTDDGAFGFDNPADGPSTLSFDLNGDGLDTQVTINVNARSPLRTEVCAGVLPSTGDTGTKHTKVEVNASATKLLLSDPGAQAVVSATVDGLATATPDLVWVMETTTDARLVPLGVGDGVYVTDRVVVMPRTTQGEVTIWAQVPGARSVRVSMKIANG